MRRADRLFRLVQLLRQRRLWTASALAGALEVSVRTVYRDVRDLVDSGVPIRGEAGVGYALERGFELPPLTFNHAEIEALVLGARMVGAWGDPELQQAARSALEKVEGVLPEPLRRTLVGTALYAPRVASHPVSPHLAVLRRAVAEGVQVGFAYTDRHGQPSERVVRPVGLHFWGQVWSVAAWCELRGDWRAFRLSRMSEVWLGEPFDVVALGGMGAYLAHVRQEESPMGCELPRGFGEPA